MLESFLPLKNLYLGGTVVQIKSTSKEQKPIVLFKSSELFLSFST